MRILILLLLLCAPAHAHETSEERIRVVIIAEEDDATVVYLRQPAALLFAEEAARRATPSAKIASAFFRKDGPAHHLDRAAIASAPGMFADKIATTISLTRDGVPADPAVLESALRHVTALTDFHAPADAERAFRQANAEDTPHVANTYIDAKIIFDQAGDIELSFPMDAIAFPGHVHLDTAIIDARSEPPTRRVVLGSITDAIAVNAP